MGPQDAGENSGLATRGVSRTPPSAAASNELAWGRTLRRGPRAQRGGTRENTSTGAGTSTSTFAEVRAGRAERSGPAPWDWSDDPTSRRGVPRPQPSTQNPRRSPRAAHFTTAGSTPPRRRGRREVGGGLGGHGVRHARLRRDLSLLVKAVAVGAVRRRRAGARGTSSTPGRIPKQDHWTGRCRPASR